MKKFLLIFTMLLVAVLGHGQVSSVLVGPTQTGAGLRWTTATSASGYVRYGLTSKYDHRTPLVDGYTTEHYAVITGLTPSTTYHVSLIGYVKGKGIYVSPDYTFSTLSPTPVTLLWDASTSSDVVGYNMYRGVTQGGPYTKINSTLIEQLGYVDNDIQQGTMFYYVATAVDSAGLESGYSNEATAVSP